MQYNEIMATQGRTSTYWLCYKLGWNSEIKVTDDVLKWLEKELPKYTTKKGVTVLKVSTDDKKVEILVSAPPNVSVTAIAQIIKGVSTGGIRSLLNIKKSTVWKRGYCVETVGKGESIKKEKYT